MNSKKDMLSRLAGVAKSAPLQENTPESSVQEADKPKVKPARRSKNVLIPEELWEAYEGLKNSNTTSLLMTPYIVEAFREKLARDGAFDKD